MATDYDNRSFMTGIAIGRQLKGWANGGNAGGGEDQDEIMLVTVADLFQGFTPVAPGDIPYEVFMLDAEMLMTTVAELASGFAPATIGDLPCEVLMLDEEIMLVTEADIIRV